MLTTLGLLGSWECEYSTVHGEGEYSPVCGMPIGG